MEGLVAQPAVLVRVRHAFLKYFCWEEFETPEFYILMNEVVLKPTEVVLQNWLFKYFEPLAQQHFEKQLAKRALKSFTAFVTLLRTEKLTEFLPEPPKEFISAWLEEVDYAALCITSLQKCKDKKLQMLYLNRLPSAADMATQNTLGNPILTRDFTCRQKILTKAQLLTITSLGLFEVATTNYIINKAPAHLELFRKLFSALRDSLTESLTADEKLVLAKVFLASVNEALLIATSTTYPFLLMAARVKSNFGCLAYQLLYQPQPAYKAEDMNRYLKIPELLFDLECDLKTKLAVLQKSMPNLQNTEKALLELFVKQQQGKYPERDPKQIEADFLTLGEFIKCPMSKG